MLRVTVKITQFNEIFCLKRSPNFTVISYLKFTECFQSSFLVNVKLFRSSEAHTTLMVAASLGFTSVKLIQGKWVKMRGFFKVKTKIMYLSC